VPESSSPTVASLIPHPATGPGPVESIEVEARWHAGVLGLAYRLRADPAALRLPPATVARRADGLWQHTCFEAFVRPAGGAGYLELNFSPSCGWSAYHFDARRDGMRPLVLLREPEPRVTPLADGLRLQVELPLPHDGPIDLGLTAVIEAADGTLGYWALRHGAGPPDFHDPESFTLRLGTDGTEPRA
jgi:hypothetical protein